MPKILSIRLEDPLYNKLREVVNKYEITYSDLLKELLSLSLYNDDLLKRVISRIKSKKDTSLTKVVESLIKEEERSNLLSKIENKLNSITNLEKRIIQLSSTIESLKIAIDFLLNEVLRLYKTFNLDLTPLFEQYDRLHLKDTLGIEINASRIKSLRTPSVSNNKSKGLTRFMK